MYVFEFLIDLIVSNFESINSTIDGLQRETEEYMNFTTIEQDLEGLKWVPIANWILDENKKDMFNEMINQFKEEIKRPASSAKQNTISTRNSK